MLRLFSLTRESYYECGDSCNHYMSQCNGTCIDGTVPCGDECRFETQRYFSCPGNIDNSNNTNIYIYWDQSALFRF